MKTKEQLQQAIIDTRKSIDFVADDIEPHTQRRGFNDFVTKSMLTLAEIVDGVKPFSFKTPDNFNFLSSIPGVHETDTTSEGVEIIYIDLYYYGLTYIPYFIAKQAMEGFEKSYQTELLKKVRAGKPYLEHEQEVSFEIRFLKDSWPSDEDSRYSIAPLCKGKARDEIIERFKKEYGITLTIDVNRVVEKRLRSKENTLQDVEFEIWKCTYSF